MLFIGDVHGKIERYRSIIRELPEGSKSLQLGDMGLGFKGVNLFPGGSMERGWHRFIRGNHDDPAQCRAHKLYLGEYGYLPEEKLFYLGGAWSIDQAWRIPNISWWPDEELSEEELKKALELYKESKPFIVATHEAPTEAAIHMLSNIVYLGHDWSPTDQGVREKGEDYAYYKAKTACVKTRTSRFLQEMFEAHQPKFWLFGHYHLTKTFTLKDTEFTCLNELATKELNL